jgi:hypothetical protein
MRYVILAAAALAAAFLIGGRYQAVNSGAGGLFVVDRFSGTVVACDLGRCGVNPQNSN